MKDKHIAWLLIAGFGLYLLARHQQATPTDPTAPTDHSLLGAVGSVLAPLLQAL